MKAEIGKHSTYSEDQYRHFFGKKYSYYESQINGTTKKWNWAAFFLGPYWLIYRNLYFILIPLLFIDIASYVIKEYLQNYSQFSIFGPFLISLIPFSLSVALGIWGNWFCIRKFKKWTTKVQKSDRNRGFNLIKLLYILFILISSIGLKLLIVQKLSDEYSKYVLKVRRAYTLSEPLIASLPDNGVLLAFREPEKEDEEEAGLILLCRNNNEIVLRKVLDQVSSLEWEGSGIFYNDDLNQWILAVNTENSFNIYILDDSFNLLDSHKLTGDRINKKEIRDVTFEGKQLKIFYKQSDVWSYQYYEIKTGALSEHFIQDNPKRIISNSDYYYETDVTRDFTYELTVYDSHENLIYRNEFHTQNDGFPKKIYKSEEQLIIFLPSKIMYLNLLSKELNIQELEFFEYGFTIFENTSFIDIWGISNEDQKDRLMKIRLYLDGRLEKSIFKGIALENANSLTGIRDKDNNLVISGITNFSHIFVVKISEENELIKGW